MPAFRRGFRLFAALLFAVPLGQGGLCCCLFGPPTAAAEAPAPPPCCDAGEGAPVPEDPGPCDCPARDAAALAATAEVALGAPPPEAGPAVLTPARAPASDLPLAAPGPAPVTGPPVPKRPLYRTLGTLLC